jgi:methyl-accepting chemotaxis protein
MILTIIELLLLISLFLIISRHLIKYFIKDIEGLTNQNNQLTYTNTNLNNDPLYLAKTNSANITYIKSRLDKLDKKVNNINVNVNKLNKQVENNTYTIHTTNNALTKSAQNSLPSKKNFNNLVNQQPIQKKYN